jgi:UDP-N-acetylmuramyl pentapeptide synthase
MVPSTKKKIYVASSDTKIYVTNSGTLHKKIISHTAAILTANNIVVASVARDYHEHGADSKFKHPWIAPSSFI